MPLVGFEMPKIILKRVVFPDPFDPVICIAEFEFTSNEMF